MNRGISTKALSERFILKAAAALFCVVVADFLMFDEDIGWTMGLFGFTVLGCVLLFNPKLLYKRVSILLAFLIAGQCMMMVERTSFLSFILCFSGVIALAISAQRNIGSNKLAFFTYFKNIVLTPVLLHKFKRASARKQPTSTIGQIVRGWALPVGLSIMFVIFFASANPILSRFFSSIDTSAFFDFMKPGRWFVWLLVALPTFHLIRMRLTRPKEITRIKRHTKTSLLYSKKSVIRSLVLFNIIFLFQSITDIMYLWGGWSLPDGITYAEYAHKGAYPLIATALLAGVFVILTARAGKKIADDLWVKRMIYMWLAQNIFLVFSSVFRTLLYVEHYSLTYLRVAALIWMLLVAGGLLILILKIANEKHDNWMLNRIFLLLFSVLYVASFPNYASLIAHYNYTHSKQVSGTGTPLDIAYLRYLTWDGEVIPVLDRMLDDERFSAEDRLTALEIIRYQYKYLTEGNQNWRSWTYRDHRLLQQIGKTDLLTRVLSEDGHSNWQFDCQDN